MTAEHTGRSPLPDDLDLEVIDGEIVPRSRTAERLRARARAHSSEESRRRRRD